MSRPESIVKGKCAVIQLGKRLGGEHKTEAKRSRKYKAHVRKVAGKRLDF